MGGQPNVKIAAVKNIVAEVGSCRHLGPMTFNDLSSPLRYLETRRSAKPRDMGGARPGAEELRGFARIAARSPDHGKLAPWRFTIIPDDRRAAFKALLERAFLTANPDARTASVDAACQMADFDAALIIVSFEPVDSPKIPLWEQELSCGAAGMNLCHAANASGYVSGWITGWASTDPTVRRTFCSANGRIAGLMFIGSHAGAMEERERPDFDRIIQRWDG